MKKSVVSLSVLLAMVLSMVSPVTALAADTNGSKQNGTVQVYADATEKNDSGVKTSGSEELQEQVISGIESTYSAVCGGASITLSPKTTGDGTFSYASDHSDVVEIGAASGEMIFKGVGTATVTVTASETDTYQAATVTTQVTVTKAKQIISGVASRYQKVYETGATFTLKAKTTGNGTISYLSDNSKVVKVNASSGKVTLEGAGTATITVNASETETNYGATTTVQVTITKGKQTVNGVSSKYKKSYKSGRSFTLKAETNGDGVITYQSSNPSVAMVGKSSGKVTMKKCGVCTITVTAAGTKNCTQCTKKITITLYKKAAAIRMSKYYKAGKYYRRLAALELIGSNRKNVLMIANSQVGYHEGNRFRHLGGTSSGSRNYTEYGYYYGVQSAWCAMFVNWCARVNGTSLRAIPRCCSVFNYYSYYHRSGQHFYSWIKTKGGRGSYTPKAGDLIFYSSRLGGPTHHIGYVRSCSVKGGKITITTFEGNTSDQARVKTMTLTRGRTGRIGFSWYIRGFASPKY